MIAKQVTVATADLSCTCAIHKERLFSPERITTSISGSSIHMTAYTRMYTHKQLSAWQVLADTVSICPAVSIGGFMPLASSTRTRGLHSPAVAALLCLMRLCPAPGTSTQEEMGPISLLSAPKRDNHQSSDVITWVSASKVITNMPKKRREFVYDVIGQCGQGYRRESSVLFLLM